MDHKATFLDFENLEDMMGDTNPEHWSKNFGKDVPERSVAAYLLRKKGYSIHQIKEAFGCSYYSVSHGINMIRRAKKIYQIMNKIGLKMEDII